MKMVMRGLIGLTVLATIPAAAAILAAKDHTSLKATRLVEVEEQISIHEKDQSRIPTFSVVTSTIAESEPEPLGQLVQAHLLEEGRMPPPLPGRPPPPVLWAPPFPLDVAPGSGSSRRSHAACEEAADRKAALVGYLKSRLRLQEGQREAWLKLEQAVDAAIGRLHAACDQLPTDESPPTIVEVIDMAVQKLSTDIDFLRTIREPLGTLSEQLSPKQRLMLQPLGLP